MRIKLNIEQRRILAEIFGNIAVAWYVAGIISPFFNTIKSIQLIIFSMIAGLIFGFGFTILAIRLVNK